MGDVTLQVVQAGPHVTVQDGGRPGFMRFGVPRSGPMDRTAFAIANTALGNPPDAAGIEVSQAGLTLLCRGGSVTVAMAGGGFIARAQGHRFATWRAFTLHDGDTLAISAGPWGCWTYLAIAGTLHCGRWLGSAATHARAGFGGGTLVAGAALKITDARLQPGSEGPIPCPVFARPRHLLRVVLGPQDRFFPPAAVTALLTQPFTISDAFDRMGLRLHGPSLTPDATLDMPSEPVSRGSVQVAGDGVASVLLADHQTTGGYPKIATILSTDLDAFAQNRPRAMVAFRQITAAAAIAIARRDHAIRAGFLGRIGKGG